MLYLLLAIICASSYSIIFKLFACKGIDSLQAIGFNYVTATFLGVVMNFGAGEMVPLGGGAWGAAALLGAMFTSAFVLMARSTERSGIALTTIAARVALVIPVVLSYLFIPGQPKPRWAIIGIIVASLLLLFWPSKGERKGGNGSGFSAASVLYPLFVFLLYGTNNFILDWSRSNLITPPQTAQLSATIFMFGSLASWGYYFAVSRKPRFEWKALVGGVVLGFTNYFTTYCMILGLNYLPGTVFFPIYHVSAVSIVVLVSSLVFGERMRKLQWLGLAVAIVGIVLFFV